MTNLPFRTSVAIAACIAGAALILSTVAGAAQENDYSHTMRVNKTWSEGGDSITVSLVRGPSEKYVAGNTYEVSGTYKLASRDKAMLAAFITSSAADAEIHHEISAEQEVIVSKGEGKFTLRFHMFHKGDPHVSFYPAEGGNSIGGVYF